MTNDPSPAARILVVDDNESITTTFGWMIEALGHEAHVVRDGVSALTEARSYLPDVILLDINMPGMNGYEVCQILRTEPKLANCIFIAQTGWTESEHVEHAMQAGFDYHWAKPIPMDRLEKLLNSVNRRSAV